MKQEIMLITLGGLFDLEKLETDIAEFDHMMADPSFWDNQEKAQKVIKEANEKKEVFQTFNKMEDLIEEITILLDMLREEEDQDIRAEIETDLAELAQVVNQFELDMLLNEPYDKNNAIVELHPGAGGTESQDWGEMLYRMYTRWVEKKGFSYKVLDYQSGDEAGIKSVTLLVTGMNAYGLLKAEKGVHRLVRISPFDSSGSMSHLFCIN